MKIQDLKMNKNKIGTIALSLALATTSMAMVGCSKEKETEKPTSDISTENIKDNEDNTVVVTKNVYEVYNRAPRSDDWELMFDISVDANKEQPQDTNNRKYVLVSSYNEAVVIHEKAPLLHVYQKKTRDSETNEWENDEIIISKTAPVQDENTRYEHLGYVQYINPIPKKPDEDVKEDMSESSVVKTKRI